VGLFFHVTNASTTRLSGSARALTRLRRRTGVRSWDGWPQIAVQLARRLLRVISPTSRPSTLNCQLSTPLGSSRASIFGTVAADSPAGRTECRHVADLDHSELQSRQHAGAPLWRRPFCPIRAHVRPSVVKKSRQIVTWLLPVFQLSLGCLLITLPWQ
jgi:hypothetical protein